MRRAVILLAAVLFASLALSASATTPPAPPWTVAQVTYAVLHPVRIVGGTLSKTGTHFDMVSTFGFAHDPSGSWDLTGNQAKYRGGQIFDTKAATCRGLGKATRGHFNGFACDLTIGVSSWPDIRTATYWIRPWSSTTVCISDRALAACPPAPPAKVLPGDPRVPTPGSHEAGCSSPSNTPAGCIINHAELAAFKVLNVPHQVPILFGCLATTVFVYRCTAGGTVSTPLRAVTVTFTPSKTKWTTSTSAVVTAQ